MHERLQRLGYPTRLSLLGCGNSACGCCGEALWGPPSLKSRFPAGFAWLLAACDAIGRSELWVNECNNDFSPTERSWSPCLVDQESGLSLRSVLCHDLGVSDVGVRLHPHKDRPARFLIVNTANDEVLHRRPQHV